MSDGSIDGMQTFDMELERLWREGVITRDTALSYATNTPNLALRMSGIGEGGSGEAVSGQPPEGSVSEAPRQPDRKAGVPPMGAKAGSKGDAKKAGSPPSEASFVDIKDLME
jgi:hypothetical protein